MPRAKNAAGSSRAASQSWHLQPALMLQGSPSGLCLSLPFLSAVQVLNSKQGQESIKRNYGVTAGIPGSHGSLF